MVSICIPCYNNVSEVERLLVSIHKQNYTDYEVNISDDSTNEETADLVGRVITEWNWQDKLHYIHNVKPLGHIYNWNAAIKMATGQYIKIMFSDDWFTDERSLGIFVNMLEEHPEASFAFSGSMQVLLDGQTIDQVKHLSKQATEHGEAYARYAEDAFIERLHRNYKLFFLGNQIGAPSAGIYRRGEQLVLFDEQSNWASDMFLYFDLLQANHEFAYTKEPLISIGMHTNQYTESFTERDMRIYNDYRYLYTKYGLQDCEECREYFTESFIIKYHQGLKEAKTLGIGSKMYWKKWWTEQKNTIICFVTHRFQILCNKSEKQV